MVQIRSGGSAEDVNEGVRINGQGSGWPGPGEGLWLAELDGRAAGAVTLRDLGGGLARLGHLAPLPEVRGSGAGRRLVETARGGAERRL